MGQHAPCGERVDLEHGGLLDRRIAWDLEHIVSRTYQLLGPGAHRVDGDDKVSGLEFIRAAFDDLGAALEAGDGRQLRFDTVDALDVVDVGGVSTPDLDTVPTFTVDPEEGAAALVSGDVSMACLFGGNSIKAATAVGSRLLTVQEARDAGILGIDITSVTDKFMKENPGMLRTFIEVTHEANARYAAGKSDMNVIAKDAEMKLGDMKETIGGFKFLSPAETEKSMTSGNLAGFLKGMDTPNGAVDTSFLPL